MLGFQPFWLDLGHIAWIWAIWQNMGQNRPQRRQSPEDGAGGTDGWTNGKNPPCSTDHIHSNPVADSWAGSVMRKSLRIQKY